MAYKIELEAEGGKSKVFLYEGAKLLGCKIFSSLHPTKKEVLLAVETLKTVAEEDTRKNSFLKVLETEINDELTRVL